MARSRLELRREAEAAEARRKDAGEPEEKPKKERAARKAPAKRTTRSKAKAVQRKRLVWIIYSGSMKEEGRFPYDQRAAAEERLETLRSKSKKLYFIQPLKEVLGEAPTPVTATVYDEEPDEEPVAVADEETETDEEPDEELELDEGAEEEEDEEPEDDEE